VTGRLASIIPHRASPIRAEPDDKEGKDKECRAATWDAVRQAVATRHARESFVKDGSCQTRSYATRYDGALSEKEMFAKNDALEAEARTRWTDCGGKADVPPDK
jgi:hypothetical protein